MKRASVRTLALLLELFAGVVALQYMAALQSTRAGAVWVAGDCPAAAAVPCDINDCAMDS